MALLICMCIDTYISIYILDVFLEDGRGHQQGEEVSAQEREEDERERYEQPVADRLDATGSGVHEPDVQDQPEQQGQVEELDAHQREREGHVQGALRSVDVELDLLALVVQDTKQSRLSVDRLDPVELVARAVLPAQEPGQDSKYL